MVTAQVTGAVPPVEAKRRSRIGAGDDARRQRGGRDDRQGDAGDLDRQVGCRGLGGGQARVGGGDREGVDRSRPGRRPRDRPGARVEGEPGGEAARC